MSMTAWRGRSGPPVARFLLSASRAVIDPVKLIGQLRTEINGGEPIRMFSLQHLGIKTIWAARSEEHTSELQSLMRISYAVFCLKKKKNQHEMEQIGQYRTNHNINDHI